MGDCLDQAASRREPPGRDTTDPRVAAQAAADLRVSMVLEVLSGRTAEDVASDWDIESSLVQRWVRDFLVAGTAAVTHRPDPDGVRQRDRFLAAFAHEMRTPVAIASGWAAELADGEVPAEQIDDAHHRLDDALHRLTEHIADVELSSAASLGLIRVAPEVVDIQELCRALPRSPRLAAGADEAVYADRRLLGRVLRDLCATACREPEPTDVFVEVVRTTQWHEIRVVREGAPISARVIRALLDPFGSGDDANGVTMGLYVARALTVAQGGFVGAEGDGDRTVLFVRLPRRGETGPVPSGPGSTEKGATP